MLPLDRSEVEIPDHKQSLLLRNFEPGTHIIPIPLNRHGPDWHPTHAFLVALLDNCRVSHDINIPNADVWFMMTGEIYHPPGVPMAKVINIKDYSHHGFLYNNMNWLPLVADTWSLDSINSLIAANIPSIKVGKVDRKRWDVRLKHQAIANDIKHNI